MKKPFWFNILNPTSKEAYDRVANPELAEDTVDYLTRENNQLFLENIILRGIYGRRLDYLQHRLSCTRNDLDRALSSVLHGKHAVVDRLAKNVYTDAILSMFVEAYSHISEVQVDLEDLDNQVTATVENFLQVFRNLLGDDLKWIATQTFIDNEILKSEKS